MIDKYVRICAYTVNYGEEEPLASVRFTSIGEDGKVNAVEQVHYWNERYCSSHVESALASGLEVCLITRLNKRIMKKKIKEWSKID
tara:strand:+ start:587 stop:844 length:258 start_codon:yes stop_codon:yes gene_type:complete